MLHTIGKLLNLSKLVTNIVSSVVTNLITFIVPTLHRSKQPVLTLSKSTYTLPDVNSLNRPTFERAQAPCFRITFRNLSALACYIETVELVAYPNRLFAFLRLRGTDLATPFYSENPRRLSKQEPVPRGQSLEGRFPTSEVQKHIKQNQNLPSTKRLWLRARLTCTDAKQIFSNAVPSHR